MNPTDRLVALFAAPLVLACAAIFVPSWVAPMIAVDLAIALVAALDLWATGGGFEAQRRVAEVQAVGRPFDVTLVVRAIGQARGLVVKDDAPGEVVPAVLAVPDAAPGWVELTYPARVDRRGEHHFGAVTARWRSPLGLWQRQRDVELPNTLRVYPNFARLRDDGLPLLRQRESAPRAATRRQGGESDFQRLRPYVRGDAYRHIDWRATARRDDFVTREFGQERNQNLIFMIDAGRMMSARLGELSAFDHALNAALMMGQVALRHGDRVGLLVFDREVRVWLPPRGGARTGTQLIRSTYDQFPSMHEPDYAAAFRHLSLRVRRRSLVVLLTSVVDEVNAELASSITRALRRRHLPIAVWLRDPGVEALVHDAGVDPYVRGAAAELLGWRERSLAEVRREGALVVDCEPDRLTGDLLSRYLDIKARRVL